LEEGEGGVKVVPHRKKERSKEKDKRKTGREKGGKNRGNEKGGEKHKKRRIGHYGGVTDSLFEREL